MNLSIAESHLKTHVSQRLTLAYQQVLDELASARYRTTTVAGAFCANPEPAEPDRIRVVVRIDVDAGLHLVEPLARELAARGIRASFYFLTDPSRYYAIWGSGVPAAAARLGMEVGLHYDHVYRSLIDGTDATALFREDVHKLCDEARCVVRGAVFHGHPDIDRMGRSNWEIARSHEPAELGLQYHDGPASGYLRPGSDRWVPATDIRISDFLGAVSPYGWNDCPSYAVNALRRARPGQTVHLAFHPLAAFRFWDDWPSIYGEHCPVRPSAVCSLMRRAAAGWRYGLLRGRSLREVLVYGAVEGLARVWALGFGRLFPRPRTVEFDTSWERSRDLIFDEGLAFWEKHLTDFGIEYADRAVLEVGSGNGQWLLAFARSAREVVGLEPFDSMRNFSMKKIADWPDRAKKIRVIPGIAEKLPFDDGAFDVVFCSGVLMFTRERDAMREMVRVLKPGGQLILTVNGIGYFWMYLKNALLHKSVEKARHGWSGLIGTALRVIGVDSPLPAAFGPRTMSALYRRSGAQFEEARVWLPQPLYPDRQAGMAVNWAYLGKKQA